MNNLQAVENIRGIPLPHLRFSACRPDAGVDVALDQISASDNLDWLYNMQTTLERPNSDGCEPAVESPDACLVKFHHIPYSPRAIAQRFKLFTHLWQPERARQILFTDLLPLSKIVIEGTGGDLSL